MVPEASGCARHLETSNAGLVRDRLQAVLASEAFRGSRRSQAFLRYVVESALDRPNEPITEAVNTSSMERSRAGLICVPGRAPPPPPR